MVFCIAVCIATTPKNDSPDKTFVLVLVVYISNSLPTFTLSLREWKHKRSFKDSYYNFFSHYDLNDTGIGVAKKS